MRTKPNALSRNDATSPSVDLQIALPFRPRGGKRRGAGRKAAGGRARVRHAARPRLARGNPSHITMRIAGRMPSLRSQTVLAEFTRSLRRASKDGLRVVHFSLQRDHIHLIVEATDSARLGRGVGGFASSFARKLNGLLGRSGRVYAGRYHRRDLGSPREVRNALVYVLQNGIKHGVTTRLDAFSSAPFFEGWSSGAEHELALLCAALAHDGVPPVVAPAGWLLDIGWRKQGLIDPREVPRAPPRRL